MLTVLSGSRGDAGFRFHWCTRIGQASHGSGFDKAGVMLTLLSGAAPELVRQAQKRIRQGWGDVDSTFPEQG